MKFGESATPGAGARAQRRPPAPSGSDPALAGALSLKVGDGLELGDTTLRHRGPSSLSSHDRGTGFAALAPRVMLNVADLPATGLVQPSSRVTWRPTAVIAPGGDEKAAQAYADWAKAEHQEPTACAASASRPWLRAGPR